MNKITTFIVIVTLVIGFSIIFEKKTKNTSNKNNIESTQNVEIIDNVQHITINAKSGYSPKISTAKADIPTKLIIKTDNTYDCSSSLVIRSIDYQNILSPTGEEIIDLDTPQIGKLQGICSMGMYNFIVNFN